MNAEPSTAGNRPVRWGVFLAAQLVVITAGVAWAGYRVQHLRAERALPPLRTTPLTVKPLYDVPVVISDEQLERVLKKLRPKYLADKTQVNHVDHALRFWGTGAKFGEPGFISGEQMRTLLTDHRAFAQVFGPKEKPLLIDAGEGVKVRTQEGLKTASHVDHTAAGLAEVGTPLDYPIVTPQGVKSYRNVVEQMLRDFSLNQIEYEWSAVVFALFLPEVKHWYTSEGQEVTFDRLAERIMRQELPQGVCFGGHRLFTLALMLQVDDQEHIFTPAMRTEIIEYLQRATQMLVRTQDPAGFWSSDWPHALPPNQKADNTSGDEVTDRILATGHALEWWAIAPEEVQPPRSVLAAAGQWLVKTVDALSEEQTEKYYTYLSHVGRALTLWRKKTPTDVILPSEQAAPLSRPAAAAAK